DRTRWECAASGVGGTGNEQLHPGHAGTDRQAVRKDRAGGRPQHRHQWVRAGLADAHRGKKHSHSRRGLSEAMRLALATFIAGCLLAALGCTGSPPSDVPGVSPEETFEHYRGLLDARALDADSRLLTLDSRRLFAAGSPSSSAQAVEARA